MAKFKKGSKEAKAFMANLRAAKGKKAAPKKAAKRKVVANYTKDRQTGSSSKYHDSRKKALPPGKRTSDAGNTYYEYRKNRTDRPGSMTGTKAPIDPRGLEYLSKLHNKWKPLLTSDVLSELKKYKYKIRKAPTNQKGVFGLSGFFDTQIIADLDQLKKEYHKLAIKYHPDKGGTKEQFQQLQNEYEAKLKAMLHGSNLNKEQQENEIAIDENLRQAINAVIVIPGISIELVGKWIWIGGNTYPVRNELKAANFLFAPVKKMWYFKGVESSGRGNLSYEEIKNKYGAERITPKNSQQFLTGIDYKIPPFNRAKFKAALLRLTRLIKKRYV